MDTIFFFEFEFLGKTFKTSIHALNETEAREVLLAKICEKVKIKNVSANVPKEPFLEKMKFMHSINQIIKKGEDIFGKDKE